MKKQSYKLLFFALILVFSSCTNESEKTIVETSKWESFYHNFKAAYTEPWELLPSLTTKKKTLFGLIDNNDGKSYVVKITEDISKEILSDLDYYAAAKEQMLSANAQNVLIDERDVQFHGENFHRQIYIMHTDKWGMLKQHVLIRRTGDLMYAIQISFPITEEERKNLNLPQTLTDLDNGMLINDK